MPERNEVPGDRERRFAERRKAERRRGQLFHFPRQQMQSLSLWRTTLYFVILAVVLAGIAYWLIHPR